MWAITLLLFVKRDAAYFGFIPNAIDNDRRMNWKDVLQASNEFGITSSNSGPISIVSEYSLPSILFGDLPFGLIRVLIDGVFRNWSN